MMTCVREFCCLVGKERRKYFVKEKGMLTRKRELSGFSAIGNIFKGKNISDSQSSKRNVFAGVVVVVTGQVHV